MNVWWIIKINHVLRKDTGCMCKYVLNIWQKNNLPANRYVLLDRTWKLTFFLSSEIFKSLTSRMVDEYVLVYCSLLVNTFSLAAGSKSTQCQLTQILGASLSKWIPCDILESNFGHSNIPIVFCGGRWGLSILLFLLVDLEWKGNLNDDIWSHGRI